MRRQSHFQGVISRAAALAHPYAYVPFEVPPRCTRIEVAYHYAPVSPADEPATLDIGLFDIRGTEPHTGGFRGWSGSDRRQFFIERTAATPGYVPGPLPAGTWSVILGGYEIPEDGLRWWLTVSLEVAVHGRVSDGHFATPAGPAPTPCNPAPGWYRGDLHSHTEHSDGENTIQEMARFAKKRGLDFLAITDHNTTTHMPVIDAWHDAPLLVIPGEEVTTYSGHANVWGLREWVDFRFTTDEEMHRLLRWVEARAARSASTTPSTSARPGSSPTPASACAKSGRRPGAGTTGSPSASGTRSLLPAAASSPSAAATPTVHRRPNRVTRTTSAIPPPGCTAKTASPNRLRSTRSPRAEPPSATARAVPSSGSNRTAKAASPPTTSAPAVLPWSSSPTANAVTAWS